MVVYFSMGSAHHGEPALADVLNSLALDASGYENAQGFEDWANEYGYDTDSRKAERTYKVCQRQSERLREFLGEDAYKDMLWNTENL